MSVMEQAKALGEALAVDEVVVRLNHAKEAYENDRSLRGAMQEYNALRAGMGEEFKKDMKEQDADVIAALKARTDILAAEITNHPVYLEFMEAQQALQTLMNDVNAEISFYAFGERPSNCTHDCSTCKSGCSGAH